MLHFQLQLLSAYANFRFNDACKEAKVDIFFGPPGQ